MSGARWDIVTFDCYGTLIDWEEGIRAACVRQAALAGAAIDGKAAVQKHAEIEPEIQATDYKSYREVLTEVARRVATAIGFTVPSDRAGFLADSLPTWQPFADTSAALVRLKQAGVRLGLLSNIDDELLAQTRKLLGVDFDLIVTAQQVRSYKPAPAHFTTARAKIPTTDRWLHAAQSYYHDVVPARALGISTAWVNRKHDTAPDGGKPDLEVPDLTALADAILG